MLLEFCAENFTKIPQAIEKGAQRIELCDNLAVGGTTPSYAVIEQAVQYAAENKAEIAVMIRPRGGNFVYSPMEFELMKKDLKIAKELKADGVVFGCLDEAKRINRDQTEELIALSGDIETVFHMAFDTISPANQKEEMDWLIEQGVTRILTHGGREGTIFDNADWLNELFQHANHRIELLIGGGVTYDNFIEIAAIIPAKEFHGTKIVNFDE